MTDRKIMVGGSIGRPAHATFVAGDRLTDPLGIPMANSYPVTYTLYVDKSRTDDYTQNGSETYPFKTIQAAIQNIIDRGDNSQTKPYLIQIAPGVYAENLVMEDAKLVSVIMKGEGSRLQTQINPASGYALQSMANNSNFYDLHMENIQFIKPTMMVGATNGNYFGYNFFFINCYWASTALATFKNMVYPSFSGNVAKFSGGVVISNVTQFTADGIGGFKTSDFTIETDENANKPNSFGTGTAVLCAHCRIPNVTWSLLNIVTLTGTALQIRAVRYGSAGETIPANAQILAYYSSLVGNYVVTGSLTMYNSFVSGTLSGAGTILKYQPGKQVGYTPAAGANWVDPDPTDVATAIDRIAAEVATLKGGPIA